MSLLWLKVFPAWSNLDHVGVSLEIGYWFLELINISLQNFKKFNLDKSMHMYQIKSSVLKSESGRIRAGCEATTPSLRKCRKDKRG